jgi:hypothetical protein
MATDTRRAAFVARCGDIAIELVALSLDALRERIVAEVESRMDLAALRRVREREAAEHRELAAALGRLASAPPMVEAICASGWPRCRRISS